MNVRFLFLLLFALLLTIGCTAQKAKLKKPVTFASLEDYRFGPEGGVDLVWSTKRIRDAATLKTTLQGYDSLILDQTWLVVDKESAGKLDDKQILTTARYMVEELEARLGHGFKLVDVPGESTLRLSLALTNIESTLPMLAVTRSLLPDAPAAANLSRVVIGKQVSSGRVAVELLVSDARSREPLIAAIDKQFGTLDLETMVALPDDAKNFISLWADRLWITLRDWNWIKTRPLNP